MAIYDTSKYMLLGMQCHTGTIDKDWTVLTTMCFYGIGYVSTSRLLWVDPPIDSDWWFAWQQRKCVCADYKTHLPHLRTAFTMYWKSEQMLSIEDKCCAGTSAQQQHGVGVYDIWLIAAPILRFRSI